MNAPAVGSPDDEKKRITVANERAKLLANAFDRASTACVTVGILGPVAAGLYGLGAPPLQRDGAFYVVSAIVWLLTAVILHVMARKALGTLR